jgi:serine protease Do
MTSNNDNERTFESAPGGQRPAAWPPTDWSTGSEWQAEPAPTPWAPPTIPSEWSAPASPEPGAAWASEPDNPTAPTPPIAPTPAVDPATANAAPPTPVAPPTARSGAGRSRGIKSILAAGLLSATLASVGTTVLVGGLRGATPTATTTPPAPTANAAVTGSRATTEDLTGIVATARQSVVTITADGLSTKGLSPFSVPTTGVGSGIVLTSNGYILTNRHVVEGSSSLTVALMDGTEYPATLVKESTTTDLALIKINASGLVAATIGDSSQIHVGQTAIAIGSPLGTFTETVTKGIISGLGREITVRDEVTGQPTHLTDLIQTDAAINPGNSGGPLLDATGAVVGVDTAVAGSAQGIGFAIPISAASDLINLARSSSTT